MTWHLIAHRSELAEPGDFVRLPWRADGGEVAIVNQGGAVFAFDNLCPHRGARIYSELRGRRDPRCAYHGRLATAHSTARIDIATIGDWFFVSDSRLLAPSCAPAAIYDLLHSTPPLTLHSLLTFRMACHWTVAVENALDFEHVGHVHGGSLARLGLAQDGLMMYAGGSSIEVMTAAEPRLDRLRPFFASQPIAGYTHAHLFPYSCISSTRGYSYSVQHYLPRADGTTTFIHRLYAAPTVRPVPHYFDSVAAINERVFREDAEVCALVPAGHCGALGTHERRIAHFRGAQP